MVSGKYVFFGAGEYGYRLFEYFKGENIICFVDNAKAGTEFKGKKILSIRELQNVKELYTVVITVDHSIYWNEISCQLEEENIPYLFSAEFLLQNYVFDLSLYPTLIRDMMAVYNIKYLQQLEPFEKNRMEFIKKKYSKLVLGVFQGGNIAQLCYGYAQFFQKLQQENHDKVLCLASIGRDYTKAPVGAKKNVYRSANNFLQKKFSEQCIFLDGTTINFWVYYICSNFRTVELYDYWAYRKYDEDENKRCIENEEKQEKFQEPCIVFSRGEEEAGKLFSESLGISKNYVCFFSRDNEYLRKTLVNFSEQEMREIFDQCDALRNSDINQFSYMAQKLEEIGIQSVRMGSIVKDRYIGPGIDYSNMGRSEFMDAYLFANCMFFVSDVSGIMAFPKCLFGKPLVTIISPYTLLFRGDFATLSDLLLFRVMKDRDGNKLSLRNILDMSKQVDFDIDRMIESCMDQGIVSLPISPENIWKSVHEMLMIMRNDYVLNPLDIELRKHYYGIIKDYIKTERKITALTGHPSASWLRENQWFLE